MNAVIKVLINKEVGISFPHLLELTHPKNSPKKSETLEGLKSFFVDRLRTSLSDQNYSVDIINSIIMHDVIKNLYNSNVNKLLISMYDGPEQITKFKKMTKEAKVPSDFVILRDRWYDEKKDYGIKLTNRVGTINIGKQDQNSIQIK